MKQIFFTLLIFAAGINWAAAECSNPPTAPTGISGKDTICSGSSTTLTATGGSDGDGAIYEWGIGTTCGSNVISGQIGVSINTGNLSLTTAYWVRRKGKSPCDETPTSCATVTVTVKTPPTAPTGISGKDTICSGSSTTLTATGGSDGGGAIYEWGTGTTCGSNVISGQIGASINTGNLNTTTTYWVRRKGKSPCDGIITSCATVIVTVKTPPTAPTGIKIGTNPICFGSSTTLTATGGNESDGATYEWGKGIACGSNVISGQTGASINTGNLTETTTYWVRRKGKSPCGEIITSCATVTVIVYPALANPQKPKGDSLVFQNTEKTNYEVPFVENANQYIWELSPDEAGSVSGNGYKTSIFWNTNYKDKDKVTLRVKAKNNTCGDSDFSEPLTITIQKALDIKFVQAPNPVCSNQEVVYEVTSLLDNVTYEWSVVNGDTTFCSPKRNLVTVKWKTVKSPSIGELTVKATSGGRPYVASQSIAISTDVAPDLNSAIVPKINKETEKPYMLIFPKNTDNDDFVYQWWRDDIKIEGATEQFYYPLNYRFETDLKEGAAYRVYVSNRRSASCGNFTKPYIVPSPPRKSAASGELFTVHPNPSDGIFTIVFNGDTVENETNATLRVFSLLGKIIVEQKIPCSESFEFNRRFNRGTYLLQIVTENNKIGTKQIVIK